MTALFGSFACAVGLTPLLGRAAAALGLVALPRADRWGSHPTPLLGGVAIVLAIIAPVALLAPPNRSLLVVLGGTVAALILGLTDDVRGLRPTSKLVGQIVIASGLALSGVSAGITGVTLLDFTITLLWVVAVMNAMNLIDNMDGLAAGTGAIGAAVLALAGPASAQAWPLLLAAATVGGCLGFLVHNFAPARIYMGDAGSMALGFLLAALALLLTSESATNVGLAIFGPLLALGVPIFDTALVTVVRRIEGRPLSKGGRDHTSHRLASLGLGERTTVLVLYGIAATMGLVGSIAHTIGLALVPLVALVVLGLILLGTFLVEEPDRTKDASPRRDIVIGAGHRLVRYGVEIALDTSLALIALMSAYLIRFEASGPELWTPLFIAAAPIVVPVQLSAFVVLGLYRVLWRYMHVVDLVVIARATLAGTAAGAVIVLATQSVLSQPRSVFFIDAALLTVFVAVSRLFAVWMRHSLKTRAHRGGRRVLVVGANQTGEIALQLLRQSTDPIYVPVGFLDDDPHKHRRRIAGVPVLGRTSDLGAVAEHERANLIVLALEREPERAVELRFECDRLGLESREFARSF